MTSEQIKALDHQSVMQTYGRFDVVIDHGEGATCFTAPRAAPTSTSAAASAWPASATATPLAQGGERTGRQAGPRLQPLLPEPYVRLAAMLTERTGMADVFFANGGGEANEGLIKLARKYSFDKYGEGRATIITVRTCSTTTSSPSPEGFRYAAPNDIDALKAQAGDDVCAVMLELVQGEGGVMPLDRSTSPR